MAKHAALHHVGIVVPNIARVEALLGLLGLEQGESCYVPQYDAHCVFTQGRGSAIEFIIPTGGKLAEFNRGVGGLHHVAIEVDNLQQLSEQLQGDGIPLLEEEPVDAGKIKINFLAPAFTRGFVVEFVETKRE